MTCNERARKIVSRIYQKEWVWKTEQYAMVVAEIERGLREQVEDEREQISRMILEGAYRIGKQERRTGQ